MSENNNNNNKSNLPLTFIYNNDSPISQWTLSPAPDCTEGPAFEAILAPAQQQCKANNRCMETKFQQD